MATRVERWQADDGSLWESEEKAISRDRQRVLAKDLKVFLEAHGFPTNTTSAIGIIEFISQRRTEIINLLEDHNG